MEIYPDVYDLWRDSMEQHPQKEAGKIQHEDRHTKKRKWIVGSDVQVVIIAVIFLGMMIFQLVE